MNVYYVHSDGYGIFSMIPSGLDQAFTGFPVWWNGRSSTFFGGSDHFLGQLFGRCLADTSCRASYASALEEARDLVAGFDLPSKSADLHTLLHPSIEADPRMENTVAESDQKAAAIAPFMSNQSAVLDEALAAKPEAPPEISAMPIFKGFEVSWAPAVTYGAKPITGYKVGYRKLGATSYTELVLDGADVREKVIVGLEADADYEIVVRALSEAGTGAPVALPDPRRPISTDVVPRISRGPRGAVNARKAVFRLKGPNEAGLVLQCRVDGAA